MNQLPDSVLKMARERLPGNSDGGFEVQPLQKGGSDRSFYRVRSGASASMIIVRYSEHKEENTHYVDIAGFLGLAGVNVPAIYLHDALQGLIFMQDLGELDLWSFREQSWAVRKPLWESALDQAVRLHKQATDLFPESPLKLEKEFSEQLYLWEQNYFFEHCLSGVLKLGEKDVGEIRTHTALQSMAIRLAALPRTLVHRDFQSQNLLVFSGETWMIDFQGMRPGLPHYDVASLLYDPYVHLTQPERLELANAYLEKAMNAGLAIEKDFQEILDLCAIQRLMQALGAYGFLGIQKQRTHFLNYIPVAGLSLVSVMARNPDLEPLGECLAPLFAQSSA